MFKKSIVQTRTIAAAGTAIAALLGCTTGGQAAAPVATLTESPTTSGSAPAELGIVAEPASSAFPLEGRNIRLVRLNAQDLAAQFELFNRGQQAVAPYDVGMGLIERDFKLVDLPRATAYDVQESTGFDGRVSDNQYDEIAPGSSATITAVFTAPPAETTAMWLLTDVLQPVEVPIESVGSTALVDDPVLTGPRGDDPYVATLMCSSRGPEGDGAEAPVEIRLPSDVLFEFAKADLTPAALQTLDVVKDQLDSAGGTITIEGHTDAIGDDASNQLLSEARATSVRTALQDGLGSGFAFDTVGFGESRPVAPNTNPDGTDNPDGRAQNRRVEIRTGDVTAAVPAQLEARPMTDDVAAQGAVATVEGVERISGHLLTTVDVTNPTSSAVEIAPGSGLTDSGHRPLGITVANRTGQRRSEACNSGTERLEGFRDLAGPPSNLYSPSGDLPPGASVTLWAFFPAPPADVTSVDVELGGFGQVVPTPITG